MNCYNCFQTTDQDICPHCGYNTNEDVGKYPLTLPSGRALAGKYMIGRVLRQDSACITYLALDTQTSTRIVVHEFFPDCIVTRTESYQIEPQSPGMEASFRYGLSCFFEETKNLAALKGIPGTLDVYQYFEENGTAYATTEYVEGILFSDYLQTNGGRLYWKKVLQRFISVAQILCDIHRKGTLHYDLCLDNILLTDKNKVYLLGFGALRLRMRESIQSIDLILHPGFAPKEQYTRRGQLGPYSDVYALGACFYSAITGYLPPESIDRLAGEPIRPLSEFVTTIPPALERIILQALSIDEASRHQTMDDFLYDLTPSTRRKSKHAKKQHSKSRALLPGGCVTLLAVLAIWFAFGNKKVEIPLEPLNIIAPDILSVTESDTDTTDELDDDTGEESTDKEVEKTTFTEVFGPFMDTTDESNTDEDEETTTDTPVETTAGSSEESDVAPAPAPAPAPATPPAESTTGTTEETTGNEGEITVNDATGEATDNDPIDEVTNNENGESIEENTDDEPEDNTPEQILDV